MRTMARVQEKVKRLPKGQPLGLALFADCGSPESVRQAVSRLTKQGLLVRAARGVYARPKPVRYLRVPSVPEPKAVARAIARRTGEVLAPHGADIARELGLSLDVTMQNAFYTTGRTRKMRVGNAHVAFQHAPRYLIEQQHTEIGRVLLALHYLGDGNTDAGVLKHIRERIGPIDLDCLAGSRLPAWMRRAVETLQG